MQSRSLQKQSRELTDQSDTLQNINMTLTTVQDSLNGMQQDFTRYSSLREEELLNIESTGRKIMYVQGSP